MPSHRKLSDLSGRAIIPSGHLLEVAENESRRRDSLSDTPTPTRSRTGTSSSPELTESEKLARTIEWSRSGWGAPVPVVINFFIQQNSNALTSS
jgi:hypothetical protein